MRLFSARTRKHSRQLLTLFCLASAAIAELDCGEFQSQQGQDAWVHSLYASTAAYSSRPLTFVELGASDGYTLSNTYGLEKCYGWHGVCIEPTITAFDALLRSGRDKCVKMQEAVASSTRPATLVGGSANISDFWGSAGGVGGTLWAGLKEHFDTKSTVLPGVKDASAGVIKSSANAIQVTTKTLFDVLNSVSGLPAHVDYLSLDVEGAELEIVEAFDFSSRSFGVITVEHSWLEGYREDIKAVLESNGYVRAVCLGSDDGYILASLVTNDGALSSARFDHRDCEQFRFVKDCAPGNAAKNTREFICNQSALTQQYSGHCTNAVEQVRSWECQPGFSYHSASVKFVVERRVKIPFDVNRAASLGLDLEELGSLHSDIRVIDKRIELNMFMDTAVEEIEDLSMRFCSSFSELVMVEDEENETSRLSSCQAQLKAFALAQMDAYHAEARVTALREMEDTMARTRPAAAAVRQQGQPEQEQEQVSEL